jgi:hypothetical protein
VGRPLPLGLRRQTLDISKSCLWLEVLAYDRDDLIKMHRRVNLGLTQIPDRHREKGKTTCNVDSP